MKKLLTAFILSFSIVSYAWQPTQPIVAYIGWAPGSQNEIAFRKATEIVINNNPGLNFIVVSKPGADGVIANNFLVTQPADGLHIGIPSITTTVITSNIWQKDIKKFSWEDCSIPVILGENQLAIVASKTSHVNNFKEFTDLIKSQKVRVNIATAGGSQNLTYEYLLDEFKGDREWAAEIRYGNSSLVAFAVASGQVEFGITAIAAATAQEKNGLLKIIGVTGDTPVYKNSLPNFHITNGYMIMLPPGTPTNIVEWYETEFGKAIRSAEYKKWAVENNLTVNPNYVTDRNNKIYLSSLKYKFAKLVDIVNAVQSKTNK